MKVIQIPMSKADLFLRIFSYIPRSIPFPLCLHVRQPDKVSKCSMSGGPYFVDVELIQIEKTELSCAVFLDH